MESETFEETSETFRGINIEDEPSSEKYEIYIYDPWKYFYKPKPKLPPIQPERIEFEEYVKNKCKNKFQILNRQTFNQINKPIVIFFNHFREKCAYHTKWLDRIYELALIYGERIEFIAADMIDMDVMYPKRNPFHFFCRLVRSKDESPNIYAIDEKKRIYSYQLYDAYKTVETLAELCENLLKGNLFLSLPIPENNDKNLVKICVHHNYEELILKSTKNIFLIINLDKYHYTDREPNYDNVALALKDYNLDIVYMEAETNYIPFEYNVGSYPTILYIPHNDKKNFVYYNSRRNETDVIDYLKNIIEKPEFLLKQQQELKSATLCKSIEVPKDFQIEFKNLSAFLEKNFDGKFKILDRQFIEKHRYTVVIVFMDFQDKCLEHHIQWLNKIYQVAERAYTFLFFIADFKDIDVINTRWQRKDLIENSQGKPKIFAVDYFKHTYEMKNFDSIAQLFYFTESVQDMDFYYSEPYPKNNIQVVKVWTADYFHIFLKARKKNIFITFYSSENKESNTLCDLLNSLAIDVKKLNVEVVKYDVKLNYIDLEYAQPNYPAQYFIPEENKRESILYNGNCLDKNEILEFIKNNIK